MLTTIVIGTNAYSSSGTVYSGSPYSGATSTWSSISLFGPVLTLSMDDYDTFEFNVLACGPTLPLIPGLPVRVITSNDDGSSPVIRFVGDLQRPDDKHGDLGWAVGYQCTGLKRRADYCPLLATDGSGVANFNLANDDPLYLFALAGQTVGQIVTAVLQAPATAAALNGVGVGAYITVAGVLTLPSTTVADLANLTIVPASPVQLQGAQVLNTLESFIQQWMPRFSLWVRPDGTIRVQDIFGFTPNAIVMPGASGSFAPAEGLQYSIDLTGCFTAVAIIGVDIQGTVLSLVAGTLKAAWTTTEQNNWTASDASTPKGASDDGTTSTVTSNSCVVTSNHPLASWVVNYWNSNGGVIVLYDLAGTGIAITETRQVTSCTALTAGGSATITWDSSNPLDSTSYTTYQLFASGSPQAEVGRLFNVREPASGALGTATFVGPRLYPRFPYGWAWAQNNNLITLLYWPTAKVMWSQTGAYPWIEEPVGVQLNPLTGQINLTQPAQVISAAMAGQTQGLSAGFPANTYQGLYYDVQVAVPYNRGDITAQAPSSGYSGTAYTTFGIERTMVIPIPSFTFAGNTPSMALLAAEHLKVVQDAVVDGSVMLHWDDWSPAWDPLTIGYSVGITVAAATGQLDGLNLPVRSVRFEWPNGGPDRHKITLSFSTLHRPFEGDALYLHPAFAPTGWGTQGTDLFIGGEVMGQSGMTSMSDFGSALMGSGLEMGSEGETGEDLGGAEGMGMEAFGMEGFQTPSSARSGRTAASQPDFVGPRMSEMAQPPRMPQQAVADAAQGLPTGTPIDPSGRQKLADLRGQRSDLPEPPLTVQSENPGPVSMDDMKPMPETPPPPPPRRKLADLRGTRDDTGMGGGGE
jgi:hypothetical protein